MTGVLGFPLEQAIEILQNEGYRVEAKEARSKKGVSDGTERRVIRQSELGENEAILIYALFKTETND